MMAPAAPSFMRDLLASVVVFLVALPLCLGIAIASGVPPAAGLIAGIVGGLAVGLLGGAPLQVSGPAAGLTVLVWELVRAHGLEILSGVVLVAGGLQLVAGLLGLGQWFRAISPAVVHGMLAGIGVLIVASQFHVMVDDAPRGSGIRNLLSIPEALGKAFAPEKGVTHTAASAIGLATISVLVAWNSLRPERLKMVPAPLIAILVTATGAALLGVQVNFVEVPQNLADAIRMPSWQTLVDVVSRQELLVAVVALGFIASAETLLCVSAVDQMHSGQRANYDRELAAQGVGNAICGALGALPLTGVIVRSSANVDAGATTRRSAILHGVWLFAFVVALPGLLRMVPTSALAAILVYTGYKLVNPATIRKLARFGRMEVAIYFATMIGIVLTDLLTGVLIGFGLALARLLYSASHLRIDVREEPGRYCVHLRGFATFPSLPKLAKVLEGLPPDRERHIHFENLHHIDHACLDLIAQYKRQQEQIGCPVIVELDALESRYRMDHDARVASGRPGTGDLGSTEVR